MRYTYTAVGPVDVEEREGEESLVAFFGEELLFELDKIGFEVNHFWCAAVSPAQKRQERFHPIWPCSNWKDTCYFVSCSFTLRYYNKVKHYNNLGTDTTILNSKCSFQHGKRNILTRSSRIYKTKWNLVSRLPVVSFPHPLYFCTAKKSAMSLQGIAHLLHSIGSLGSCWANEVYRDVNRLWSPAPGIKGSPSVN